MLAHFLPAGPPTSSNAAAVANNAVAADIASQQVKAEDAAEPMQVDGAEPAAA